FPIPERREVASFVFADLRDGLETIRTVVRAGWRPAVLRLYDATEALRQFSEWVPADRALLLAVSEGPSALVEGGMVAGARGGAGGRRAALRPRAGDALARAPQPRPELGSLPRQGAARRHDRDRRRLGPGLRPLRQRRQGALERPGDGRRERA